MLVELLTFISMVVMNLPTPVIMMIGVSTFSLLVWTWLLHQDHDDDDEMYYAFFNADASPVATPHAFAKILERVPEGARVLDIGIGSGTYLEHPPVHKILRARNIRVDGVDISAPNVAIAQSRIKRHKLESHFTVKVQDARKLDEEGAYDAILFMESFPCMSKPLFVDILCKVQRLLKPTGVNYLYHNLADPAVVGRVGLAIGRLFKPSLKLVIGIDFGRLTSKPEMEACLADAIPNCKPKDEILLSASPSEISAAVVGRHLDGVRNRWHRFCGRIVLRVLRSGGPPMEQHLITLPAAPGGVKDKKA